MTEAPLRMNGDAAHWAIAAGLVALWLLLSWRWLRKPATGPVAAAQCLVVYASQTGHAEDLARETHRRLRATLEDVHLFTADRVTAPILAAAKRIYFIVSTTGEGDAPDNARHLDAMIARDSADLSGTQVGVLALGDRRYAQFCAFGNRIRAWAERMGARISGFVTVDDLAPADLAEWDRILAREGFAALTETTAPSASSWHVVFCKQVAPAAFDAGGMQTSDGLYRLSLVPEGGAPPDWEIGDLFELRTPDGHIRDYSIANRPGAGEVQLFVRRVMDNGIPGRGSGLLTEAEPGRTHVTGRIREHRLFRPATGHGPILAIGAGSGWAGLRPHLAHAMAESRSCWLVFGERTPVGTDALLAEMQEWHRDAGLQRLELAFSREHGRRVQDVLADKAKDIAVFLGNDGCIVLCGRLAMGEACLAALRDVLGAEWMDQAKATGRLRCDFY